MIRQLMRWRLIAAMIAVLACDTSAMAQPAAAPPAVGQHVPAFSLQTIDGTTVSLGDVVGRGPVVLLMMRGWPGYQCPFCTRQFGDYLANAEKLQAAAAQVIFVYPGPRDSLLDHARAFTAGRPMPANFTFLTDPDFAFTNAYGLRWDAPKETAYPATFVLDPQGRVVFARISREHGDRVPVSDVLAALSSRP